MEDVVIDPCPECGEEEQRVLHGTAQSVTLQCSDCRAVRTVNPPRQERIMTLNTVVSHEDRSWNVQLPTASDAEVREGDEFELDGHRMIVTAIEVEGNRTVRKALAKNIRSLFAKVFDTVPLKLAVNDHDVTKSYRLDVDPDMQVPVGLVLRVEGQLLAVKTLKSDKNRTLHKGFLLARNVRRAFCDLAPHKAREGDVVPTRPRGRGLDKPAGAPPSRIKGPRGQRSRSPKR